MIDDVDGLQQAVAVGRWTCATQLCQRLAERGGSPQETLDRIARQARLHQAAAGLLGGGVQGQQAALDAEGRRLHWASRRNLAAIDGHHHLAAAALRHSLTTPGQLVDAAAIWPRMWHATAHSTGTRHATAPSPRTRKQDQRLLGVVRPQASGEFTVGEAGLPRSVDVAVGVAQRSPLARGTPVVLVGHWAGGGLTFDCSSVTVVGDVPDYGLARAAVAELAVPLGKPTNEREVGLLHSRQFDPSVLRARARRREGEWAATLAAAEVLEAALATPGLTLEALAQVHALTVGPASPRAGQLRRTPAVIRWSGLIVYRAPPVEAALCQGRDLLLELTGWLRGGLADTPPHPAQLAATSIAALSRAHPFADGNGRVARAVASWLLLRSGFVRRGDDTLATYLDANIDEHYAALANLPVSPWAWYQLCYDAILATFTRRPPTADREDPCRPTQL